MATATPIITPPNTVLTRMSGITGTRPSQAARPSMARLPTTMESTVLAPNPGPRIREASSRMGALITSAVRPTGQPVNWLMSWARPMMPPGTTWWGMMKKW